MPVPTSAALAEHYASGGGEITLVSVEMTHPQIAQPIRVVANVDDDMTLPLGGGGQTGAFVACAFSVTFGGHDEDGPTEPKIRIDNVSGLLFDPLEAAQGTNQPITVVIRTYLLDPPALTPVLEDTLSGLILKSVTLTADTAEGTLYREDGRTMNFPSGPNAFFDLASYPGLFTT